VCIGDEHAQLLGRVKLDADDIDADIFDDLAEVSPATRVAP